VFSVRVAVTVPGPTLAAVPEKVIHPRSDVTVQLQLAAVSTVRDAGDDSAGTVSDVAESVKVHAGDGSVGDFSLQARGANDNARMAARHR